VIPGLYLDPRVPQPYLVVAVSIPDLSWDYALVPFVIDTGAARSCIHAGDAIDQFRVSPQSLDPRNWTRSIVIGGVGGRSRAHELQAEFYFRHDDGRIESVSDRILVGDITTRGLPSLLGMDILQKFDLRVNPNIIALQRVAI